MLLALDMYNDFSVPLVNADAEIQLLRDFICSIVFPEILEEVPLLNTVNSFSTGLQQDGRREITFPLSEKKCSSLTGQHMTMLW